MAENCSVRKVTLVRRAPLIIIFFDVTENYDKYGNFQVVDV